METLQTLPLPNLDVPGEESLYVRLNERAWCELARPRVHFLEGGECTTDTFYGGLTIGAWKRTSPVRRLVAELEGDGRFLASIGVHRLGQAILWLGEREVDLAPGTPLHLPLAGWDRLTDGMLFMRLRARRAGVLQALRYRTDDPAPNRVRLGLVITHFNRPAQVLPAIERIRRQVLSRPEIEGRITLTVVDNSCNLPPVGGEQVRQISNHNYGGSGGFARGLLALEQEGDATHVLFMDDDASCEAESILRTYALLRYAVSPRLAIAGALVSEAEPWQLLEKGACFDGKCLPLHAGKDLRRLSDVLFAERRIERPDYGGWWFFAFPLRGLTHYPFPFFVRGDDVFFSLHNRFEIATLNGIACLAEEFRVKHGPMTAYLDARYHLLHAVLREHGRARILRRLVSNHFVKPLMGYHYASARAFTLALRHVSRGPQFFVDNLDLASVRSYIAGWTPAERLHPVERHGLKLRRAPTGRERPLRALLRVLTLHGFLLPRALLKDRVQIQEKSFYGRGEAVFRFRRVLYEHVPTDTGYIAEHDRALFFRELRGFLAELLRFSRQLPRLQRAYADAVPKLASRAFWADLYGQAGPVDADAAREGPTAGAPRVTEFAPEQRPRPVAPGPTRRDATPPGSR